MTRRADLERVALHLSRVLGRDACMLVGGLAVTAHGYVRATEDVDLIAREPLVEVTARLKAAAIDAALVRGDVRDGDFPCVKGRLEGIPFDVLPPLVRLEWGRATTLRLGLGTYSRAGRTLATTPAGGIGVPGLRPGLPQPTKTPILTPCLHAHRGAVTSGAQR